MRLKKYTVQNSIDELEQKITTHVDKAKRAIQRTVDSEMVKAYWLIGRDIVEEEQQGEGRAKYGSFLIKELSARLTSAYKKGFSVTTLKEIRMFYLENQSVANKQTKGHALRDLFEPQFSTVLGWIHYRALMRVKDRNARQFYQMEAEKNCWSGRELERQIASLLYFRLAKSKDKEEVLRLAQEGQEINKPEDVLKEPFVLEFLGLPESHQLVESKIEGALIDNLQEFLLELGKGFSFVDRQKRVSLDGDHYYADLVFYHVVLKCYIIIDIKTHKLTHGDLGQIQLYVNYFDKEIKQEADNPTIGLVLSTHKKDEMAKYLLGDKAKQIFTSTYQLHLPTEQELENEIKREVSRIEHKKKLEEFLE